MKRILCMLLALGVMLGIAGQAQALLPDQFPFDNGQGPSEMRELLQKILLQHLLGNAVTLGFFAAIPVLSPYLSALLQQWTMSKPNRPRELLSIPLNMTIAVDEGDPWAIGGFVEESSWDMT
jgi:hypothetical protein